VIIFIIEIAGYDVTEQQEARLKSNKKDNKTIHNSVYNQLLVCACACRKNSGKQNHSAGAWQGRCNKTCQCFEYALVMYVDVMCKF
jgi:hypothetical protein